MVFAVNFFSRMYVCSSYDFRKHHSSVVVAEHTIFDLRVMNRAERLWRLAIEQIGCSYLFNAVVIPVKLECFLFHLTISSGGVVGCPMSPACQIIQHNTRIRTKSRAQVVSIRTYSEYLIRPRGETVIILTLIAYHINL